MQLNFENTTPEKAANMLHGQQTTALEEICKQIKDASKLTFSETQSVLDNIIDVLKRVGPEHKILSEETIVERLQPKTKEEGAGPAVGPSA